jgi:transmembrane 9 superfamily protein 2/4
MFGMYAGTMYINNHVRLTVHVHEDAALFAGFRVVGFEVEPFSVRHSFDGAWAGKATQLNTCNPLNKVTHELPPQPVSDVSSIVFTYDVQFQNSDIRWASRWDMYLKMSDPRIHWFSIVNSFVIVLFLSAMIAMIMVRTLHRDLLRYNTVAEDREAAEEETGWKLVHGDVFRAPQNGGFLCILTGAGAQIIGMTCLTISFAALGLLSPANRGALMTAFLVLFALMGSVAGYTSARFYKVIRFVTYFLKLAFLNSSPEMNIQIMELTEWRSNTLWTSLLFPGAAFAVFFVLNLVMWAQKSSAAVPFVTLLALLVLWFGISVPLVYLGAYFGYRTETKLPVKVMPIPRLVPDQPAYMSPLFGILVGGVLPFGAIFIEVFFIMSSVWHHQYFYMFGFLLLVLVILIITCAEITIVMTYFQLCSEDYHWWWRSFLTAGSSAIYLFAYSILYFFTKLSIVKFLSAVLFFGYMFLVSFAFFLLTGAIGFVSCWIFVTKIYGAVKVD